MQAKPGKAGYVEFPKIIIIQYNAYYIVATYAYTYVAKKDRRSLVHVCITKTKCIGLYVCEHVSRFDH